MFEQKDILQQICGITALVFLFILLFISLFYHMIYKPDYRPGHKSMPLIWIPFVKYIYKRTQQVPALSYVYTMQLVTGMCKIYKNQKLFSLSIGGRTTVFVYDFNHCQDILKSTKWNTKSIDYEIMRDLFLDSLSLSEGEKWVQRRKLLTPTFHFKILQEFTPLIQTSSEHIVEKLKEITNQVVNAELLMKKFCTLILLRTVVGLEFFSEAEHVETILGAIDTYVHCNLIRQSRPWLYTNAIYKLSSLFKTSHNCAKTYHDFIRKIIKEKRNNYFKNINSNEKDEFEEHFKGKQKPFLDVLLYHCYKEKTLTEEDILEETATFFSASVKSVGSGVAYALYCLGLHKDVQKRVQEEIDEVVGYTDRKLTQEDLNSMTYLDCAIKESLRLFSLFFISRSAPEDATIGEYIIPKGTTVAVVLYLIHRDPSVYPNPEKYDPSRFFPENTAGRNPYSFLPFSAGPRNCIGQKYAILTMKLVITAIMRWFDVEALDGFDKLYDVTKLTSESDVPVRLKFVKRKSMKYDMQ